METREKGETSIVCSLIPGNIFKDGKAVRGNQDFGLWAKQTAAANDAFFIDLNSITADKYDAIGADKTKLFFPGDHTHTNEAGAKMNAASVIEGLKQQKGCSLNKYVL